MKAVLIDPFTRTITDVLIDSDASIAPMIGAHLLDCMRVAQNAAIYVNDEGLYAPDQAYWRLKGERQSHIGGKALALGVGARGESCDLLPTAAVLAYVIEWTDPPSPDDMDQLRTITVTQL
jgi:hypothetical protein